jgi:hypothetical protein
MNIFPRHVVYLIAFCIILAIAVFCAETGFPEKTSAASTPDPIASAATTAETVEETVTLSASEVKTWAHGYQWYAKLPYCGPPFHMFPPRDEISGAVFAGYLHYYDKGAKIFGCPDGASAVDRGTVWFDLSSIASKAPPLHVSVKSSLLHFKKDTECPSQQLLIAKEDWLKGLSDDTLVAGDPIKIIPACAPPECVLDVTTVVNNWVRGEDHGGYQNYGFVIKGPIEGDHNFTDNDGCMPRYSDFSLTVTYRYDKAPAVIVVPVPQEPATPYLLVAPTTTRKNVALASNGGVATASSTNTGVAPSLANDGDRKGLNHAWSAASGTFPQWLQIDFKGSKTIDEIDVFTTQDNYMSPSEPTESMTFSLYGLSGYDVQYWDGSSWVTVMPGGSVTGNDKVWRKFTFKKITTTKIRVLANASPHNWAHIMELEAWGK